MESYWYFWIGFAFVGLLFLCPFLKLLRHAVEIGDWKKTYNMEYGEWKDLNTIADIDNLYSENKAQDLIGKKFLLEKKAYLFSKVNELSQKKEFAKSMFPLLIQSIIPESIALFFLGKDRNVPCIAFIVAILIGSAYLIVVFILTFNLLSIILKSETPDNIKDEYELQRINKIIDNHGNEV